MRLVELHVCPLWEDTDGGRRIGFEEEDDHPPVVGWVVVMVARIHGRLERLVLTKDAV